MQRFTASADDRPIVTWSELQSRCTAAAKLALRRSVECGWADVEDIAAQLLAETAAAAPRTAWATAETAAPVRSSVNYGPRPNYSKYNAQKSQDAAPLLAHAAGIVPAAAPSFTALYNRAVDLRRTLEANRRRDRAQTAETAELDASLENVEGNRAQYRTISECHSLARELLNALGLPRLGKAYPLAYAAARRPVLYALDIPDVEAAGIVAAELGYPSYDALRQALSRARRAIPSAAYGAEIAGVKRSRPEYVTRKRGRSEHADALALPVGGIARKPSRSRALSGDLGASLAGGLRDSLPEGRHAEIIDRVDRRRIRRTAKRPAWAENLPAATAARLERADALRYRGPRRSAREIIAAAEAAAAETAA